MNNVECFICHNYGHVAVNCRSRLFKQGVISQEVLELPSTQVSSRDIVLLATYLITKLLITIEGT